MKDYLPDNDEAFQKPAAMDSPDHTPRSCPNTARYAVILNALDNLQTRAEDTYKKVSETNGRVKILELWKASTEGFLKGVKTSGSAIGHLAKGSWVIVGAAIGWLISIYF